MFFNFDFFKSRKALKTVFEHANTEKIDILYICIGFSGQRMSGDKNFYLALFENLAKSGKKIFVISISDPTQGAYYFDRTGNCYPVLHLKRPYHLIDPKRYWSNKNGFLSYRHQHNVFLEHFERYITLRYWRKIIGTIVSKSQPAYIHYIDTFVATPVFPKTKKIITQGKIDNKYPFLYKIYLNLVFKKADICVYFNKEQEAYLPAKLKEKLKIVIQPWGVKYNKNNAVESIDTGRKNNENKVLILWTGYLQQIGYNDFLFAKNLAEIAVKQFNNIEFIFAFKPEINIELPESSERITFCKPGKDFGEIMKKSDILFSPLVSRDTIIGPPLTWIEYISTRKPILTTNVNGLGSYFEKNLSILTFVDESEFILTIEKISNNQINLSQLGENAFNVFTEHFDLEKITKNYITLYKT